MFDEEMFHSMNKVEEKRVRFDNEDTHTVTSTSSRILEPPVRKQRLVDEQFAGKEIIVAFQSLCTLIKPFILFLLSSFLLALSSSLSDSSHVYLR